MRSLVCALLLLGNTAFGLDLSVLGAGEQVAASAVYGVDDGSWDWDEAWDRSANFIRLDTPTRSFGFTERTLWFRLDWTRAPGDTRQLHLAHWLVHLDHVQIRFRDERGWAGQTWHLGVLEKNELPRLAPLSVQLPEGDRGSVLIRIWSNTNVQFDPRIYDLPGLTWARVGTASLLGAVIGFLVLMCVVSLFVGFRLEDRLFLWYAAYVGSMIAFMLAYSGFLQTLFPDAIGLEDIIDQPINALVFMLAAVFAYQANTWGRRRLAVPLFVSVGAIILTGLVFQTFGNHRLALQWASWVLLVLSLGIELGAIVQALRGHRFSRFFVVGWTVLLFSSSWVALGTNGIPGPWADIVWDSFALLAGVVVEIVILAAAMADRVSRVYQELDHQRTRAARADRLASIGVMTAQVGHEINTPNHVIVLKAALLDSIHDKAETLLEAEPYPELQKTLGEMRPLIQGIRDASGQIHRVTQDLGGTSMKNAPAVRLDLGRLVHRVGTLYSGAWREKTRRLTIRTPSTGTHIRGIEYRLHQLIVNLVNNGLQALASPDKALSILVNTAPREVHLTVTDEGCGMTSEVLDKLGKLFFTTRHDDGGTGLGWRLCQEIAREHTARIEIASIPDRGTTVMVRFPSY